MLVDCLGLCWTIIRRTTSPPAFALLRHLQLSSESYGWLRLQFTQRLSAIARRATAASLCSGLRIWSTGVSRCVTLARCFRRCSARAIGAQRVSGGRQQALQSAGRRHDEWAPRRPVSSPAGTHAVGWALRPTTFRQSTPPRAPRRGRATRARGLRARPCHGVARRRVPDSPRA
jgi:hypothetical protein